MIFIHAEQLVTNHKVNRTDCVLKSSGHNCLACSNGKSNRSETTLLHTMHKSSWMKSPPDKWKHTNECQRIESERSDFLIFTIWRLNWDNSDKVTAQLLPLAIVWVFFSCLFVFKEILVYCCFCNWHHTTGMWPVRDIPHCHFKRHHVFFCHADFSFVSFLHNHFGSSEFPFSLLGRLVAAASSFTLS